MTSYPRLIFTDDAALALQDVVSGIVHDKVMVVCDSTVNTLVATPLIGDRFPKAVFPAGEANKNLDSLLMVWHAAVSNGLTRHSLIINIGGGVTTDLGGFAAATFKRGIQYINVPTTLLGAVDAAVGGKTGIDFLGLKNEIGAFAMPTAVVFDTQLFDSLPLSEKLSGYGEMIKHSLLRSRSSFLDALEIDVAQVDHPTLLTMVKADVELKMEIVSSDPFEKGIRKALNLGHTFGHALEEFMLSRGEAIPHGVAVAHGLLVAMILSHQLRSFESGLISIYASFLRNGGYSVPAITCDDYDDLIRLMMHDKKNSANGLISFTLLNAPGHPAVDCLVDPSTLKIALDIYRDYL
ncbi:MAG: 3-dehydroquinate synthase [Lachnoclostridium sp.]|nr:3-dehydroquinate synthase [Lachnoclostridium sp.]